MHFAFTSISYMSDTTMAYGFHLLDGEMRNQEESMERTSKLIWKIQPTPGKEACREWKNHWLLSRKSKPKLQNH